MLSQDQLLTHYVQALNKIGHETLQRIFHQGNLRNYLQAHNVLSSQQWEKFRWLYIEYVFLFYAQQEGRIAYNSDIFQRLFQASINSNTAQRFYFMKPNMISGENFQNITTRFLQQGLLNKKEVNSLWNDSGANEKRYIAHYELLSELGRGGMGVVYKVMDTRDSQICALKLILPSKGSDSSSIKRFHREKEILMRLKHRHIVSFRDAGIEGSCYYLVMDFIDGFSLNHLKKCPPIPDTVELIKKLAQALHYAHHNNVIHRDIKPENIMIDVNFEPVLMDFGIAKVTDFERMTMSGRVPGSPRYMSPEQVQGQVSSFDGRSDIYSLGACFYRLLTAKCAIEAKGVSEILNEVVYGTITPPSEINPGIPKLVEKVCMRCLEKDPNKRYQQAQELIVDLEDLILRFSQQPNPQHWQYLSTQKTGEKESTNKPLATDFATLENLIAPSPTIEIGNTFHHYEIEGELGRGGMGVVYKVRDTQLNRTVALKVVQSQHLQQDGIKRFMQEIQAIASLNHPNIVQLFEYGNTPQTYYTMEYIEGITFKSFVQNKRLPMKKIAEVVQKIAQALHCVHQEKIIHRDIKPANIMIVGEEPKVMDFGLAKVGDSQLSQTGTMLGTLAYMSPEQADGQNITRRADIYSLGATLYEALTKRPPFQGQSTANLLNQIYNVDPIPPRQLNPDIDRDLEIVCLKCLEKDPKKRYQTAGTFARDLQNYCNNLPISARPPGLVEQVVKWCQRRPAIAALVVVVNIAMILISFSWLQTHFALRETEEANRQKQKALDENKKLVTKLQDSNKELNKMNNKLAQANREKDKFLKEKTRALADTLWQRSLEKINNNNYTDATRHFMEAYKILNSGGNPQNIEDMLLTFKYNILLHLPLLKMEKHYRNNGEIAIAKNGEVVACLVGRHSVGKRAFCYYPQTNEQAEELALEGKFFRLTLSADGKYVGALGENFVEIIHLATKKKKRFSYQYKPQDIHRRLAFSHDGKILAIKSPQDITLCFVKSGKKKVLPIGSMLTNIYPLAFSPDNTKLVSLMHGELTVWEKATGWQARALGFVVPGDEFPVTFSPDGNTIACGDREGNVVLYDLKNNTHTSLREHNGDIFDLCFNGDGQLLTSVGQDKQVILWNMHNRKVIFRRTFHNTSPGKIAFTNKDRCIAVVGSAPGGKISYQTWEIRHRYEEALAINERRREFFNKKFKNLAVKSALHKPAVFSRKARYVAVAYISTVFLWDRKKHTNVMLGSLLLPQVNILRFTPDEKYLAILYRKGTISVFRTADGKKVFNLSDRTISAIDFLDNDRLLCDKGENTLACFDIKKNRKVREYSMAIDVTGIQTSLDGEWIALGYVKSRQGQSVGGVQIVDKIGNPLFSVLDADHQNRTDVIAWHPNKNMLAVGCTYNGIITLFQRDDTYGWTVKQQKKPLHFSEGLKTLSFSPDGDLLAMFMENDVVMYDIKNGFRTSLTKAYVKKGVANVSPDWSYLVLPGNLGGLQLFNFQDNNDWAQSYSVLQQNLQSSLR
ncbi:serine/threonine-protein kinase [Candidatus Uabimicrobium amorphum]|uniref:non-specific serine/threonine protein kinase n=1 Tax=Uabimicrobium amorphum TaxID=2596890 RepID=A0A5S9IQN5_UABAM|nr:serine/threonine-protein kinase [Candidatus Uabimicrobium amorphum]BBM85876.1 protein kinase [Candidatus Uabimicrobium amorphum]